jgi:hypothetical protein
VPEAINLPAPPSLLAGCRVLMLALGGVPAERLPVVARFSIPSPIVGGLLRRERGMVHVTPALPWCQEVTIIAWPRREGFATERQNLSGMSFLDALIVRS